MSTKPVRKYKNFSEIYLKLKPDFPNLVELSQDELDKIQIRFKKDNADIKSESHIITFVILFCSFVSLTVVLIASEPVSQTLIAVVFYLKHLYLSSKNQLELMFALAILSVFPFMYLLILPTFRSYKQDRINEQPLNPKLTELKLVQLLGLYSSSLTLFLLLFFFGFISDFTAMIIANILLFIPVFIFSTLLITLTFIVAFRWSITFSNKANNRISTSYEILLLLDTINTLGCSNTSSSKDLENIVRRMLFISKKIKNFPDNIPSYRGEISFKNDFLRAGICFENNIKSLLTLAKPNAPELKNNLINYFNIFINGNLDKLQKSEAIQEDYHRKKPSLILYIKVLLYILSPIILVILIEKVGDLNINSFILNVLNILYLPFATIVILNNVALLNPELRVNLMDFIKRKGL